MCRQCDAEIQSQTVEALEKEINVIIEKGEEKGAEKGADAPTPAPPFTLSNRDKADALSSAPPTNVRSERQDVVPAHPRPTLHAEHRRQVAAPPTDLHSERRR